MLNEKSRDLRDLMVINKVRNPNMTISAKSLLIFSITWLLWLVALYYLVLHYERIIHQPVVGGWTLLQIGKGVLLINLFQLNVLLAWSLFADCRWHKR